MLRITIFVFLLFSSCLIYSQNVEEDLEEEVEYTEEPSKVHFLELSYAMSIPTGVFAERVDQSQFSGFGFSYLQQLKKEQPAFLGAEIYYAHLGSLSRTYGLSISNEIIDVDGSVSSNIVALNLVPRFYPRLKLGPIEPFVEGHFGGKVLYAYLSETGLFFDGEEYSNFEFERSDFVLTYGGAIGLQVYIGDSFYILLKGSYQASNSGSYLKRVIDENVFPLLPIDGFELEQSATNIVKIDIGFTYLY